LRQRFNFRVSPERAGSCALDPLPRQFDQLIGVVRIVAEVPDFKNCRGGCLVCGQGAQVILPEGFN
jgi:hypothetical protein